ncbi:MAG: hypothetical protein SFU83_12935 [Meiothermus sp.]|nr:hypothetical protein [Meiothermus sp.]
MASNTSKGKDLDGQWWKSLPAITSPFPSTELNKPIDLIEDRLDVFFSNQTFREDQKTHLSVNGRIYLDWLPKLRFGFVFEESSPQDVNRVRVASLGIDANATNIGYSLPLDANTVPTQMCKFTDDVVWGKGKGKHTAYIIFHIPNFLSHGGHFIDQTQIHSDGNSKLTWRWILEAKDWRIAIDTVNGVNFDALKKKNGFQITHVGRLERADGKLFSGNDGIEVLNALGYFLSFARGAWTHPFLFYGYNQEGHHVWGVFHKPPLSPYKNDKSWLIWNDPNFISHAWIEFWEKWKEKNWRETLRICIAWYLESLNSNFVEKSLVLTLAAFERLFWQVIEEEKQITTSNPSDASGKIRELLSVSGVKPSVPSVLRSLSHLLKRENKKSNKVDDGAHIYTWLRNGITHPNAKNLKRLTKSSKQAVVEAARMANWWLEECMLKQLRYSGLYISTVDGRMRDKRNIS